MERYFGQFWRKKEDQNPARFYFSDGFSGPWKFLTRLENKTIIFPNSPVDPDLCLFQPNGKKSFVFFQNVSIYYPKCVLKNENYDIYDTDEKDKTMKTGAAVWIKVKKIWDFPAYVKSGSASKWKVGSGYGSASKRCRSTALFSTILKLSLYLMQICKFLKTRGPCSLPWGTAWLPTLIPA